MNHCEINKNLKLMKWIAVASNAFFVIPVLALYYAQYKGVDMQGLFIIEAVFAISLVLMEVPSGWLSDVWHRTHTLSLGLFCYALGGFLIWLGEGFTDMILSQIIMGTGASLVSGTDTSIVYDSLLDGKREKEFRKYEGVRQSWGLYFMGLCALAAGWLYGINPNLPAMITAFFLLGAAIISLFVVEPTRVKETVHKNPFVDMVQTLKYTFRGHAEVACIIVFGAVLLSVTLSTRWSEQGYLMELGVNPAWFGVIGCIALVSAATAGRYAHAIEDWLGAGKSVYLVFGITFLCLAGAAVELSYIGVICTIVVAAIFGYASPIIKDGVNRRVNSGRRATVISGMGLANRLIFVWLGPLTGYIIDTAGVQMALMVLAIFLLFGGTFVVHLLRRQKLI